MLLLASKIIELRRALFEFCRLLANSGLEFLVLLPCATIESQETHHQLLGRHRSALQTALPYLDRCGSEIVEAVPGFCLRERAQSMSEVGASGARVWAMWAMWANWAYRALTVRAGVLLLAVGALAIGPANARATVFECEEPECDLLGSGTLVGGVRFGDDCVEWYLSLVVRDDPSQGFDFLAMPRLFDVPYTQAMEGVVTTSGPGAPDFDAFAAELSDGDPDDLFLCYFTKANFGGAGTCDSGTGPSGSGPRGVAAVFGLSSVDFAPDEILTLRMRPTIVCTFPLAEFEVLPEPGRGEGMVTMVLVLAGLAAQRRRAAPDSRVTPLEVQPRSR